MLQFTALVTCPECDTDFEGFWRDDSITEEDMTETPVAAQRCPECGYTEDLEWPGWMHRSEAG